MRRPEYMSIKEAAEYTGFSESYIIKRVRKGEFPGKRAGRKYLVEMNRLVMLLDDELSRERIKHRV